MTTNLESSKLQESRDDSSKYTSYKSSSTFSSESSVKERSKMVRQFTGLP